MPQGKRPHLVDVHVGHRLRTRRVVVGLTQEKLGSCLGLTFQQIQKYEKGTNRISASRLFEMSQILKINIEYFFEDLETEHHIDLDLDFRMAGENLSLIREFSKIKKPSVRKSVALLVNSLAEDSVQDE